MSLKTNFSFPDCWEDDIRMNALFSPFRPKSINPEYYGNKLNFWQTLIYDFCKLKVGSPVLRKKDLEIAFKRNDQIPHCLETIIEEMIDQKIIQEQSEFFRNSSNSWTSWILCKLIKNPLKWGYNKIVSKSNQDNYQFIHCDLLKQLSSNLLFILQRHSGKVFSLDDIKKEIKDEIFLNETGLKFCLYNLSVENAISLDFDTSGNDFDIKLIKIPSKINPFDKLTEIDRNLQQLKDTRKYLSQQVKNMEDQITEYKSLARKHIRLNNRKQAEIYLKKKQYLQKNYEKKIDILFNIDVLIGNIEDAQDNGRVISALKMGSKTLNSLNSKLTIAKVDEIMSTMDDMLNNHTEIQDSFANFDIADLNDSTLEKELNELLLTENGSENETLQIFQKEKAENRQCEEDLLNNLNNLKIESSIPSNKNIVIKN